MPRHHGVQAPDRIMLGNLRDALAADAERGRKTIARSVAGENQRALPRASVPGSSGVRGMMLHGFHIFQSERRQPFPAYGGVPHPMHAVEKGDALQRPLPVIHLEPIERHARRRLPDQLEDFGRRVPLIFPPRKPFFLKRKLDPPVANHRSGGVVPIVNA